MTSVSRARSGRCLLAAVILCAISWQSAELDAQDSGPEPATLRLPTGGDLDAPSKPRNRRWRKATTAAQPTDASGDSSDGAKPINASPAEAQPRVVDEPELAAPAAVSPNALPANAAEEPGKAIAMKAYAKSRTAKDEAGFSDTIDLCRDALQAGVKNATANYARQLMSWAHNRRGEIHAAAERDEEAYNDFDAAVELDGSSWRALHNRGVSYAVLGKNEKALADFNRSIQLNPDFAIAYFNRGETYYESGDFEAALADYDTAARLLPEDAGVFNSRGHAHFRLAHYKQAVTDFNRTLKLDPRSAAAYLNRGDVYAAMGNYAAAARDYDASIRIQPNLGRAHQSMAWLLATCPEPKFRNPAQAVVAAKMAIELDGQDDHRYLATLAAAYASAGKFDNAERIQRQAVKWSPPKLRPTQEKRLALYHNRKPFRTEAPEGESNSTDRQVRSNPRSNVPMTSGVRQASGYTR